jgi:hypothetical protein
MYSERKDGYTNTLLFLARSGRFPHRLLDALTDERVVRVMTSEGMEPAGEVVKKGIRRFRSLLRNPTLERAKALGTLDSMRRYDARLVGMTGADAGATAPVQGVAF